MARTRSACPFTRAMALRACRHATCNDCARRAGRVSFCDASTVDRSREHHTRSAVGEPRLSMRPHGIPHRVVRCEIQRAAIRRRLPSRRPLQCTHQVARRCARRNRQIFSIVLAFSSGGSRHGNTVMSAFGQREATSMEATSGCAGVSSGRTRIGV